MILKSLNSITYYQEKIKLLERKERTWPQDPSGPSKEAKVIIVCNYSSHDGEEMELLA